MFDAIVTIATVGEFALIYVPTGGIDATVTIATVGVL